VVKYAPDAALANWPLACKCIESGADTGALSVLWPMPVVYIEPMSLIPTFAEFCARAQSLNIPDGQDAEARWIFYDEDVFRIVRAMFDDAQSAGFTDVEMADVLTRDFLEAHFGSTWVADRFGHTVNWKQTTALWRALRIRRMRDLARRIYEFQSFEWFAHFVEYVRTNDVASALFEADVLASLLVLPGNIGRTVETGSRGKDFDIEARFGRWERRIPIEVKAKGDDTQFSRGTIVNTIKAAAKQLPKGKIGWAFLSVPGSWLEAGFDDMYENILSDAVRQTSRVGAIFIAVDVLGQRPESGLRFFSRRWIYFVCPQAPTELVQVGADLHHFLINEFDAFAPRAPF
jgi:hypothetical protein